MTTDSTGSIASIRARFPALQREHNDEPIAYFDGPGGTQVPAEVADAVRGYLLEHNANEGWNYPTSHETDAVLAAGRAAFADLFNGSADEIAFGQNMTTLTLRVSRALGRSITQGDVVVVTELDHHANVDPWVFMARERGAEVRIARMDTDTGTLDLDDLYSKLDDRVRVLAIGAASNALGTITDVGAAAERAHEVGATIFVDAVHYAPHALIDVERLGCDFLVVSPYKFYGPHSGVLWGRNERLEGLDLPRVASAPDAVPERMETGTLSFEAIAGATAAVDFLAGIGGGVEPNGSRRVQLERAYRQLHDRGRSLFERLWKDMSAIDGARLYGPPPDAPRTPTLCFTIHGVDPREATAALAERGVFVTHGDFYAKTVVERLGFGERGMLRAGCSIYTTGEEVDRLVEGVRSVTSGR